MFRDIRAGDVDAVRARLDAEPSLVDAVAKAPPKRDDGQSTLQVAIKSANVVVAHLLLDRGADVDFMEESDLNPWRMPVLHDATRAAVLSARFWRNRAHPEQEPRWEWVSTTERFRAFFGVLERMLDLGADVDQQDSYGNSVLARACLDANQILDTEIPPELDDDLNVVFSTLLAHGADPGALTENLRALASAPIARYLP